MDGWSTVGMQRVRKSGAFKKTFYWNKLEKSVSYCVVVVEMKLNFINRKCKIISSVNVRVIIKER